MQETTKSMKTSRKKCNICLIHSYPKPFYYNNMGVLWCTKNNIITFSDVEQWQITTGRGNLYLLIYLPPIPIPETMSKRFWSDYCV